MESQPRDERVGARANTQSRQHKETGERGMNIVQQNVEDYVPQELVRLQMRIDLATAKLRALYLERAQLELYQSVAILGKEA
jgi:hypothetical protein